MMKLRLLLTLSLAIWPLCAYPQQSDALLKPPLTLVLSEVMYWPKTGQTEWIEMTNLSNEPVDLKGWRLMDGQQLNWVISEDSLVVPPKGFVLVFLDGKGGAPILAQSGRIEIHSPADLAGGVLGDSGGQLALYSPGFGPWKPYLCQSYVAWGHSPADVYQDAAEAGRWLVPAPTRVRVVAGTVRDRISDSRRFIEAGASIGLATIPTEAYVSHENWMVFAPGEINPGELRMQVGIRQLSPPDGEDVAGGSGIFTLQVARIAAAAEYEFQVCSDAACEQTFLRVKHEYPAYIFGKPMPAHSTYFWRARAFFKDGTYSAWSPVRSITLRQRS